jgi:hypothetical protein
MSNYFVWSCWETGMGGRKAIARGELFIWSPPVLTINGGMLVADRTHTGSQKVTITLIICVTLVLLVGIGSWVYVQHQQIAQKDRTLAQQKQLNEYDQAQLNARNKANIKAQCENTATNDAATDPVAGLFCNK